MVDSEIIEHLWQRLENTISNEGLEKAVNFVLYNAEMQINLHF